MRKRIFLTILCVLVLTGVAFGGSVCLEWSPNSEPDLEGYRVFTRESSSIIYDYVTPIWTGAAAECCIDNVDTTKLNYFVVRAFDSEGFESGNSNEVYLSNGPPASPGRLIIIPQGN